MFKNILLGAGVLAALLAILIFSGRLPIGGNKKVTVSGSVVMWGTLPQTDMEVILQRFNTEAKTYRVDYLEVPENKFTEKLTNALASGQGPDMILAPYQTLLEHKDRIYPYPSASVSTEQFKNYYVDGASVLLGVDSALALPVSIEPLMMFYNRALFAKHGVVTPPDTWDQLSVIVPQLTVSSAPSVFQENGIAFGTYNNIDNAKDIIMTLVAQLGQVPVTRQVGAAGEKFTVTANVPIPENQEVEPLTTSVRFFTQFADPQKTVYTWNTLQPRAIDQFAAERLAIYLGYSGDRALLMAKNPRLDFGMRMVPQAKGYTTFSTGMRLYGVATLKRTPNSLASLTAQSMFAGATYGPLLASLAGGVSPLRNVIANSTAIDQDLKQSILVSKGWYDTMPLTSGQYIERMINDIISGRSSVSEAVGLCVSRLTELYTH